MEDILNLRYALDTFYFLVMGAFVMWMAAGFSMLEAGLVRAKNTTEILTKNVALYAIACVMYMLVGYNLMYPGDAAVNSIWPGLSFLLGTENDPAAVLSASGESWYDGAYYSGRSDFFFQVVFVATAMSIVSGAVAERMKLWPFLAFCVVLTGFIYPIQGFWKWGGGFLDGMGFSDFAGSGVVHLTGATAALAGVWMVGARKGKYSKDGKVQALPGANLPLATLGTFILWLGWFGFNGGSELVISNVGEANAVAAVFVNTNAAAAGGVVAALLAAKIILGRADLTMVLNGALAGLVAITAEPLAPSPLAATLIGAVGGAIVVLSVLGLDRLRIDDPVGAISVHGVVGIWGLLAVPITNSDASLITQLIGAAVIFGFVMIASLIAWGAIKAVAGLRVTEEEEYRGVDVSECGLEAYPEFTSGPK
ncbi:MAG: ammonium transporter [Gammaproteobacteria bacterium]|nr:ammonium transporter [Gammaproteobacteria bacterium]